MKALPFILLALAPSLAFAAPLKPGDAIDVPRASGPALTLCVGARELSPLGPPAFIAYVGDVAAATVVDGGDEGLFVQLFEGFAGNTRCVHQTVSRDAVRPAASAPAPATRAARIGAQAGRGFLAEALSSASLTLTADASIAVTPTRQ